MSAIQCYDLSVRQTYLKKKNITGNKFNYFEHSRAWCLQHCVFQLFLQNLDGCKQCVAGYYCPNLANFELTACELANYSVMSAFSFECNIFISSLCLRNKKKTWHFINICINETYFSVKKICMLWQKSNLFSCVLLWDCTLSVVKAVWPSIYSAGLQIQRSQVQVFLGPLSGSWFSVDPTRSTPRSCL